MLIPTNTKASPVVRKGACFTVTQRHKMPLKVSEFDGSGWLYGPLKV